MSVVVTLEADPSPAAILRFDRRDFRMLGPGEGRNPGAGDRGALKPLAAVGIPSPDHEQPRVSPAHATREGPEANSRERAGNTTAARRINVPSLARDCCRGRR